jgi:hypothetical protein
VLLSCLACTSKPTSEVGSDAGAGGEGGAPSNGSGGKAGAAQRCPAGTNPKSAKSPTDVGVVTGSIVDELGAPTSAGLVQVCGKDICVNARVGDDGKLAQAVNQTLDSPACKFGDGLLWGKLALPLGAGDTDLGELTTVRLPDYADAASLDPGADASSGGVTLRIAGDARVEVDILTYETESQRGFRAAALPDAALSQLKQDFVEGFALAPLETRICPSPTVSLANNAALDPGTAVELYMLGFDVLEGWAPYGQWQHVADGQVSDDGKTLDFPGGLPLLTTIAVKVKP